MASIASLVPDLRPWADALLLVAGEARLYPRITSARRTFAQQSRLYRRYLAGLSQYPVAPPGRSAHELGLAFDLVVSPMDRLSELGEVWEGWGGVWGGRGQDPIHFEAPGATQAATRSRSVFYDASRGMVQIADELGQFVVLPYSLWRMLPTWMQEIAPAGMILKYFDLL